jgi:predicted dehydrogenase
MMSQPLRFAVIGAGAIGLNHLHAIDRSPRAKVVALAETSPQRRQEAADKFHVPTAVADYRELLGREDVDAVSIALPNYLHAPVALAALRAGKHVHLDKPMAFSAREATAILAAAKKAKRVFMVGQNQRFSRDAQTLKHFITNGTLGDIYHARAWWLRRAGIPRIGSWFTQKKFAGGGCLLDIGVHMLDLGLHLMDNFQPETVTGITHRRFGPRGLGDGSWGKSEIDPQARFDVDDLAAAFIKLKGGKSIILEVSWAAHIVEQNHGVQVYGTEGGGQVFPVKICKPGATSYDIITPEGVKLPYPEERLHHFIECVLDGKKPMVAPEQSLAVQKILDGIYQSAKTGKEVRLR